MWHSLVDSNNIPLDKKLDELFNHKTDGFFIELGANNGLTQSNTAFFEFNRNWTGILVEPSYNAFVECKNNRPKSYCFNLACVSSEYKDEYVEGDFNGNLMSSVDGIRNNSHTMVKVKSSTLESIIDSITPKVQHIDLLSLDTEGYEMNILNGLNLQRYRPTYLLIEVYTKDYNSIVTFLDENGYDLHSNFSNYSKLTNPHWDGTHNDYLFIKRI